MQITNPNYTLKKDLDSNASLIDEISIFIVTGEFGSGKLDFAKTIVGHREFKIVDILTLDESRS